MRAFPILLLAMFVFGCGAEEALVELEELPVDLEALPETDEPFDPTWLDEEPSGEFATLTSELSRATVRCQGPYNCTLPNPRPSNAACGGRNRLRNPALRNDDCRFGYVPGAHLRDGRGTARGQIVSSYVKINYGQRKVLNGSNHVYAFAVHLDNGLDASGWIREGALNRRSLRSLMPTVRLPDPRQGFYEKVWLVTGGDPNRYGKLKVAPNIRPDDNVAASDYLLRPGNVVNFLYNLPGVGGVSIDTVPSGVFHFRRARGVREVRVPLYYPKSRVRVGSMGFVYGQLDGRFGWIARAALE